MPTTRDEGLAARLPLPVFDVSSHGWIICLAMSAREHVDRVAERPPPSRPSGTAPECLFCRAAKPRGGEEHILSVALGNWFWVLPPDVVCANCNHGVLSRLDTALQKHPFIALMRVLTGIPGRSGQRPHAHASNVTLSRDTDGGLRVRTNSARHVQQTEDELRLTASWSNHGPRQQRDAARALLKFGLGMLWLGRGAEEAMLEKYDHLRAAILGERHIDMEHGFGNSALPTHVLQGTVISHEENPTVRVTLDYFGIQLWAQADRALAQT